MLFHWHCETPAFDAVDSQLGPSALQEPNQQGGTMHMQQGYGNPAGQDFQGG